MLWLGGTPGQSATYISWDGRPIGVAGGKCAGRVPPIVRSTIVVAPVAQMQACIEAPIATCCQRCRAKIDSKVIV